MNQITINGKNYSGNNISITNGKVIINGTDVTPDSKTIEIKVNGNIEKLDVDACDKITITGNVSNVKTMSADVDISGDVTGSVQTMSGDVHCSNVGGSISTMSGDIKYRKN